MFPGCVLSGGAYVDFFDVRDPGTVEYSGLNTQALPWELAQSSAF